MNSKKNYSPREEAIKIFRGEDIGYFPRSIFLGTATDEIMKKAGICWKKIFYDGKEIAKRAVAANDAVNFNAISCFVDGCLELEALGGKSAIEKGVGNTPRYEIFYKQGAFEDGKEVKISKGVLKRGRIPEVLKALKILKDKYNDRIPIASVIEGPFNLACQNVGITKIYKMVIRDVEKVKRILNILSDMCIIFGNEQLKCGSDLVAISEPFVSGVGAKQFRDIIIPVYQKISKAIKGPMWIHICGDSSKLLEYLPSSGFEAFSFDSPAVSVKQVKEAIGKKMKLMGSVPTVGTLLTGSKEDVFKCSIKCIEDGVDILAPSCGLPPETPIENLKAMVDAINYYNKTVYKLTF